MLLCFIGGCKYYIDSAFFDGHIIFISKMDFLYERLLSILFNVIALVCLYSIVKDEVGEIFLKWRDKLTQKRSTNQSSKQSFRKDAAKIDVAYDYVNNVYEDEL